MSLFAHIPLAPGDPILGVTEAFLKDMNPKKVNLGVGVYQDANGKMPVLPAVKEAERRILEKEITKSYLPIDGLKDYSNRVQTLLFGEDSQTLKDGKIVTVQTLGGSGALRVGADLLKCFFPQSQVWISRPSWENHRALFEFAGFEVKEYPYYDPATGGVDFEGMKASLEKAPKGTIVLLHVCCHNPTGVDLTKEQWNEVHTILAEREALPFLDFAYQGFGDGLEEDSYAVRLFSDAGTPAVIANSFSKNFGLYRERVGALSVVTQSKDEAAKLLSQLKRVIRTNYSNPSSHGAHIVAEVLADPELKRAWEGEVTAMRERIKEMRDHFVNTLAEKNSPIDFSFVRAQRGMFSYSGLSPEVVDVLREKSIYILRTGRICLAALNHHNVEYVCDSILEAIRK